MTQPSPDKKSSLSEIAKRIRDNIPDTQPSHDTQVQDKDYIAGQLGKAQEELERLRAENERLHKQLDSVSEAHNVMAKEGNRLRAELREAKMKYESEVRLVDEVEKDCDRLRAELAKLRRDDAKG